jgi:hypothetical protein
VLCAIGLSPLEPDAAEPELKAFEASLTACSRWSYVEAALLQSY